MLDFKADGFNILQIWNSGDILYRVTDIGRHILKSVIWFAGFKFFSLKSLKDFQADSLLQTTRGKSYSWSVSIKWTLFTHCSPSELRCDTRSFPVPNPSAEKQTHRSSAGISNTVTQLSRTPTRSLSGDSNMWAGITATVKLPCQREEFPSRCCVNATNISGTPEKKI